MSVGRSMKRNREATKRRGRVRVVKRLSKSRLVEAMDVLQADLNTYYVGIDPDLHTSAIAVMSARGVEQVMLARTDPTLRQHLAACDQIERVLLEVHQLSIYLPKESSLICVVELPEVYSDRKKGAGRNVNAQDIVHLGLVAGGCYAGLLAFLPGPQVIGVRAQDWTGQVSKGHRQRWMMEALGWKGEPRFEGRTSKITGEREPSYWVPSSESRDHIPGAAETKNSDWKHLMDAISLAGFALQQRHIGEALDEGATL